MMARRFINDGPTVYGSFFQGEVYDARKEAFVSGWSTASYDEGKDWKGRSARQGAETVRGWTTIPAIA